MTLTLELVQKKKSNKINHYTLTNLSMLGNILLEHNIIMNLLHPNTTRTGISTYHFTEKMMTFHIPNNVTRNSKFLIWVTKTNNSNKLFMVISFI